MQVDHWEALAADWGRENPQVLWRAHSDAVNTRLLERWLPSPAVGRVLKTDLFDEAFGQGLMEPLLAHSKTTHGIDISAAVIKGAKRREPRLRGARADVRRLPFADGAFDVVVSISTLDHFPERRHIHASLVEIHRALRPGGRLVLTLDNAANPIVALRNALPLAPLRRLGLVPYYVGATYGPAGLCRSLDATGFRVLTCTATVHCPRVLAVAIASLVQRRGGDRARAALARALIRFEGLVRLPTRYLTGYFIAVLAEKP